MDRKAPSMRLHQLEEMDASAGLVLY